MDDEIFLKEFLKGFYHQVITIRHYDNFEMILAEWIKDFLRHNKKSSKTIFKLMENHEENEDWFSSLIGFFYEHGINGNNNIIDKNKSLELYLSSINKNEDRKLISMYQLLNIIIAKILLSFYYYKDIILDKRNFILKETKDLKNMNVMTHDQFENFNGLEINICKDEINFMEKYFESGRNSNENQTNCIEKKELIELNNLGHNYQYGIGKRKDKFKAFEYYLKSAERRYSGAKNNLGYCYQNGIGVTKNEKRAFEWYLKAANEGDLYAKYNLGICYQNGIGINKDIKKSLKWYFKSAEDEYSAAQNILGNC
jgi:TPR repeat protein